LNIDDIMADLKSHLRPREQNLNIATSSYAEY
jgi:hypothetical protein